MEKRFCVCQSAFPATKALRSDQKRFFATKSAMWFTKALFLITMGHCFTKFFPIIYIDASLFPFGNME